MRRPRRGFTLTEIAISLLIIVVAVVSSLMFLASSLRHQQENRYAMYAAAVAVSLLDSFSRPREEMSGKHWLFGNSLRTVPSWYLQDRAGSQYDWGSFMYGNQSFGSSGQFDLERMLPNSVEGVIPVPDEIARRLDSPGDEIRRVLDDGGHIYFLDPSPMRGFGQDTVKTGVQRAAIPEVQKLVFAVRGAAQQNTLPNHPVMQPQYRLYPFPPAVHGITRGYTGWGQVAPRIWRPAGSYIQPRDPANAPRPKGMVLSAGGSIYPTPPSGDLFAGPGINSTDYLRDRTQNFIADHADGVNWEWLAYLDRIRPPTPLKETASNGIWNQQADWSPWRAGAPEFRRLAYLHWDRIQHQMSAIHLESWSTDATQTSPVYKDFPVTRDVTVNQIKLDQFGKWTIVPYTTQVTEMERRKVGESTTTISTAQQMNKYGIPSPATGLPMTRGSRGTDVMYEDQETCAWDRLGNLRVGMPGLERRVMYRTAALALVARTLGYDALMSAESRKLGTVADTAGDPNVIDQPTNLPDQRNPLLQVVDPPANRLDIHPAQVLALSYLAHAAVLVTGYQPPFVNEANSPNAALHTNLVQDESTPYRALTDEQYWLLDHTYVTGGAKGNYYSDSDHNNPSYLGHMLPMPDSLPLHDRVARDLAGNPIKTRRFTGPVLNPFPPPYANRGAFDWRGRAQNRPVEERNGSTWQVIWRSSNYAHPDGTGFTASDPSDLEMARTAVETCLRWTMAYVGENPYDLIVPKPLNRPTAFDRPLYAFDLFDAAGNARRPTNPTIYPMPFYPVMWGSDRANFGLRDTLGSAPVSYEDYRKFISSSLPTQPNDANRLNQHALLNPATSQSNSGYEYGYLANSYGAGGKGIMWDNKVQAMRALKYLHGYPANAEYWNESAASLQAKMAADAGPDGKGRNPPASPRRDRWWYNKPFDVADRCRELVFWAVDWKQYEDAESVPSQPYDESRGGYTYGPVDAHGNPERMLVWINPARDGTIARPPNSYTTIYQGPGLGSWARGDARIDATANSGWSFRRIPHTPDAERILWVGLGHWGADRNGNGVWDRGPVLRSARMRAVEVGRFPCYDPVMWTAVRK